MSMQITINDKNFTLLHGYQKDTKLRHSFNQLVEQVFHSSFEDWYQLGYWNEKYIPYTLFDLFCMKEKIDLKKINRCFHYYLILKA